MSDDRAEEKVVETREAKGFEVDSYYYYPNKWARVILISAEEVMGKEGIASVLKLAQMQRYIDNYPPDNMKKEFPFAELGRLQQAFWDVYGSQEAQALAVRAGEQSFWDGLAQFKSVAAAAQVAMRVDSLESRARLGLEFFSKFFNSVSDQVVRVDEDEDHWFWTITRCPVCWGRSTKKPVCHLAIGVLQAGLDWLSDGRRFHIVETACKAKGDENCVIEIGKLPIE